MSLSLCNETLFKFTRMYKRIGQLLCILYPSLFLPKLLYYIHCTEGDGVFWVEFKRTLVFFQSRCVSIFGYFCRLAVDLLFIVQKLRWLLT